jgi:hypothetical protein
LRFSTTRPLRFTPWSSNIATVDKFAGLPWLAEAGAFFGHVDREDQWGFYGAADPRGMGTPLFVSATLAPPALIIQDELHLISGPLGTVAAARTRSHRY